MFTHSTLPFTEKSWIQSWKARAKISTTFEVQKHTGSEPTANSIFYLKQQIFEFSERERNFDE